MSALARLVRVAAACCFLVEMLDTVDRVSTNRAHMRLRQVVSTNTAANADVGAYQ